MEYKLTENDLQWRPQYAFYEATRRWVIVSSPREHNLVATANPSAADAIDSDHVIMGKNQEGCQQLFDPTVEALDP